MTSDSSQWWQVPGGCWEDIQSFTMEWKHRAVTHSQTSAQASPCEAQGLLGVGTREAEHPGAFLEGTTRQRNPAKQKLNENLQKKKGKLPKAFPLHWRPPNLPGEETKARRLGDYHDRT